MRGKGMIRRLDDLGRVVIPIEMRRELDINVRDPLEIFLEEGQLIIKKHEHACAFCGSKENLNRFLEKHICDTCLEKLQKGDLS